MYFIDEREIDAIRRVFSSRKLFRYQMKGLGECDLFEREFSEKLGTEHALLLTSGTNALIAALAAGGIGPGDEVIIPSYTFVATATAVINVGAIPVIANIDETLGISPRDIVEKITERTKAIIPVHMDGLAANMNEVCRIASERNLLVIEDVAQAIGGSYKGKRLGTFGAFGCFSLNENKHISCGEGGIVTTGRRDYYERAFCVHDASAQFNPARKSEYTEIIPFMGTSMRVSEISGAIMRVQLQRLDGILNDLRSRKEVFLEMVSGIVNVDVPLGNCPEGDCASSFHLLFPEPDVARRIGQKLRNDGILFAPVTARPAHACWKWASLLGNNASHIQSRNPYSLSDIQYSYNTTEYLPSVDILMRTLKMDIDIHKSLAETSILAEAVSKVLREM